MKRVGMAESRFQMILYMDIAKYVTEKERETVIVTLGKQVKYKGKIRQESSRV